MTSRRDRPCVEMDYRNRYDVTGDGFHRFIDPEDETEYVYSNFQPFDAHRLFPCFDQPDIKATYPADRRCARGLGRRERLDRPPSSALPDGRRRHRFARTPRFSTYLLPLIAGHWHAVHEERDGMALGLYARRSMARLVEREADELFEVTRQGFRFYAELFDQPFPFDKYDQLFVPEFNAGAMENVGAVTFHDSFLFRDPPTEPERLTRAEVVLHELAHMWFGDLVTMRWWDDLWLNESFATYLSFLALDEATRFTAAWRRFNGVLKPLAYRDDQLITTHPIASDVRDTDEAELGFDGITYEKGASVLKQLVATIGRQPFRDGVRTYFRRHAWDNATLADFLDALASAAGRPLDEWARGLDQHRVPEHHRDPLERRGWPHRPDEHPPDRTRRPSHAATARDDHRLVDPSLGGDAVTTQAAIIDGCRTRTCRRSSGLPAPAFVFPNHGDHDYAKVILDPVVARLRPGATGRDRGPVAAPADLVGALGHGPGRAAAVDRVPRHGPAASSRRTGCGAPGCHPRARRRRPPALRAGVDARRGEPRAGDDGADALAKGPVDIDDDRRLWLRLAIASATSAEDVEALLDIVDGTGADAGPARRPGDALAARRASDGPWACRVPGSGWRSSATGTRRTGDSARRIRAEVSQPDAEAKLEAWRRIHDEGYGSDYLTRAALSGFQWHHQRDLLLPFREPFFERGPARLP